MGIYNWNRGGRSRPLRPLMSPPRRRRLIGRCAAFGWAAPPRRRCHTKSPVRHGTTPADAADSGRLLSIQLTLRSVSRRAVSPGSKALGRRRVSAVSVSKAASFDPQQTGGRWAGRCLENNPAVKQRYVTLIRCTYVGCLGNQLSYSLSY